MDRCQLRDFLRAPGLVIFFIMAIQAVEFSTLCYSADTAPPRPKLQNPFCNIETYIQRDLKSQGRALIEPDGRAAIQIGAEEAVGDTAYRDFLMAHECCHHTRGHLARLERKGRERAMLDLSFVNRSLELDADCCAAVALGQTGRQSAIREAARRMRLYGGMPTGAGGYPAGNMRALLIEQCAAGAQTPAPPGNMTPDRVAK
jgi:hypothetical protein